MISPLDLDRLAVRIETLQRRSRHGWHPADDLEFKNLLPGGHDRRALPDPTKLRGMSKAGEQPDGQDYRLWLQMTLHMEGLAHQNDPRNPRRIIRDMARGRFPLR